MDAYLEIQEERLKQDRRWGVQDHDDFTWMTVLSEEVGEAAECSLRKRFALQRPDREFARIELRKELVQVAAVAVAWIECLDRKENDDAKPC